MELRDIAKRIRELVASNHAVTLPDALHGLADELDGHGAETASGPATYVGVNVYAVEVAAEKAGEEVAEAIKTAMAKAKA